DKQSNHKDSTRKEGPKTTSQRPNSVNYGEGKRVEKASEFALSEVFFPRRAQTGSKSLAMALRSWEQLRDHDEAYAEAQTLLGDWLDNTWKPELDLETHGLTCEKGSPATPPPPEFNYDNFDDLYHHLADEEDHCAVDNFLQDLKKQKVLDGGMMEKLVSDGGGTNRTFTDPVVTMELRHRQVKRQLNLALNEEEAKMRREREQEERKRQEARRRQQERVQQEIVRMRRQREERKALEQRLRYRLVIGDDFVFMELAVYLPLAWQCLQRHFSRWYSAVMEQRLRMGKAKALCDWKRQLGAWQAWRTVMWAGRNQREVSKTEEELRTENRQRQLAEESDRRRLQRRYLHEWRLWCRQERDQRELLAQQQETRRKMAALIDAATTGQFKPPDTLTSDPPDNTGKVRAPKIAVMSCHFLFHELLLTRITLMILFSAMEERARVRAERKKQTEELKRVKEEEKQAEMKAAEERKLREEEVEKAQKLHERRLARMVRCFLDSRYSFLCLCVGEHLMEHPIINDPMLLPSWQLEDLRLLQESQADVFCRAHTLSRFLRALRDHVIQEKRLALEHQQMAEEHDNRAALRRCFQAWRLLPCLERKEREREERRERLCRKVNEVLPSFWSRPL
uniref:Coiled-coil domain containing 191 n=1 Tax=Hippocampus comes TaxID=109280 RepID=A0A3Q2Z550_HIPCM